MPKGNFDRPKYIVARTTSEPPAVLGARWIPLTRGKFALVDEADFGRVNRWNWSLGSEGYAHRVDTELGPIRLHRFIMNCFDEEAIVDHANHDTLDNRKPNLRICSKADNNRNVVKKKSNTSSKYKGVYFEKSREKWKSQIGVDGKKINLGRYATEEAAAIAYNKAAVTHFGAFASLNKVNEGE